VVEDDPKTPAGRRAVALDKSSVQILRVHRRHELDRRAEAAENGKPWTDSGYVFTRSDRLPIKPELRQYPIPDPRPPRQAALDPAARPAPRRRVPDPTKSAPT
jgi:hypothetical protein